MRGAGAYPLAHLSHALLCAPQPLPTSRHPPESDTRSQCTHSPGGRVVCACAVGVFYPLRSVPYRAPDVRSLRVIACSAETNHRPSRRRLLRFQFAPGDETRRAFSWLAIARMHSPAAVRSNISRTTAASASITLPAASYPYTLPPIGCVNFARISRYKCTGLSRLASATSSKDVDGTSCYTRDDYE